jgi:hypothetical protein
MRGRRQPTGRTAGKQQRQTGRIVLIRDHRLLEPSRLSSPRLYRDGRANDGQETLDFEAGAADQAAVHI